MDMGNKNSRPEVDPADRPPGQPVYMVRQKTHYVRINPEDIVLVQIGTIGVELVLGHDKVQVGSTIEEVLEMLPPGMMARINPEQAVNLDHLMMIGPGEVWVQGKPYALSPEFEVSLLMRLHIVSGW